MVYISFEEVKEILKKSIDETTNINEALEKTVQFIYSKGYEDGFCSHNDKYHHLGKFNDEPCEYYDRRIISD